MKELINLFIKDLKEEGFSLKEIITYGIVFPIAIVLGCIIAEIIQQWR